jgi:hypothetical protein
MESSSQLIAAPEEVQRGCAERFSVCLKRIRTAVCGKQFMLSQAIGCSDAAVSFWESGARVPNPQSFVRLLDVLAAEGTPHSDLVALRRVWVSACSSRRSRGRAPRQIQCQDDDHPGPRGGATEVVLDRRAH